MTVLENVEQKYAEQLMNSGQISDKDMNALAAYHKSLTSEKEIILNHDAAMTGSFVELAKGLLTCGVSVLGIAASAALVSDCTKFEENGTYTTTAGQTALRNLTARLFKW